MLLFVRSDVQNLWGVPTFLGVLILPCGKERNMYTRWHICKTLSTYKKLHVQKFYYKLKKSWSFRVPLKLYLNSWLKYRVFVFPSPWPWPPAPICFWHPRSQFLYSGPSPQICIYQPPLSICIFQPRALNLCLLALANRVGIIRVKGCI